jgi:hypothetical protein
MIITEIPGGPHSQTNTDDLPLARISHKLATATANASVLTAFRSVGLLNILHEYACGGFGRRPCQIGAFTVSLRKPMRKAG